MAARGRQGDDVHKTARSRGAAGRSDLKPPAAAILSFDGRASRVRARARQAVRRCPRPGRRRLDGRARRRLRLPGPERRQSKKPVARTAISSKILLERRTTLSKKVHAQCCFAEEHARALPGKQIPESLV